MSDALPPEAPVSPIIHSFNNEACNAKAYQISAKLDNPWLSY